MGDLASDGYNWYVSGDFRHQDDILVRQPQRPMGQPRLHAATADYNRTPGSQPGRESEHPVPQLAHRLPDQSQQRRTARRTPICRAATRRRKPAIKCQFYPAGAQLQPATTNVDILAKFTKELGSGWEIGLQASWFDSRVGTGGLVQWRPQRGRRHRLRRRRHHQHRLGARPGAQRDHLPDSSRCRPTTPATRSVRRRPWSTASPSSGLTNTQVETNTYRLLASISGNAAGWEIKRHRRRHVRQDGPVAYGNIEPDGAAERAEQRLHPRQLHRRVTFRARRPRPHPPASST